MPETPPINGGATPNVLMHVNRQTTQALHKRPQTEGGAPTTATIVLMRVGREATQQRCPSCRIINGSDATNVLVRVRCKTMQQQPPINDGAATNVLVHVRRQITQ